MADTPRALLDAALASDPARPLMTFYDDTTGERVELSVTTFDNWVAKTANLLLDELLLDPGARVAVRLPPHWQAAVVLMAAWSAGASVALDSLDGDAVFVDESQLPADTVGEVVALSLRPLGAGLAAPVPGVVDFATEVRGQPDRFPPRAPADPGAPALAAGGRVVTAAELVTAARAPSAVPPGRVLSTLGYDTVDAVVVGLLAPLAAGTGVVLCRRADPALLARRAAQERVAATAGVDLPGLPRLG